MKMLCNKISGISQRLPLYQGLLFLVLTALVIGLSLESPFFLRLDNLRNILDQSTLNIITGVGMTLIICAGGIDLSVGAVAAFTGVITALLMSWGWPIPEAVGVGLLAGLLVGMLNGSLVAGLRISPFIVTLAMFSVIRGLTLIITEAIPISGFDRAFTWIGSGRIGIITIPVIIAGLVAVWGWVLLNTTRTGRYFLALGENEEALRRCGVSTRLYNIAAYAAGGLTAALAGLVLTARLNSADPTAGYMMELDAIATAVLGGTSMKGGIGSIGGTVLAGLLLAVLRNGLTINGILSYYQQLLTGFIILLAVIIAERRKTVAH